MMEAFEQKYKDDLGVLQLFEKHIDNLFFSKDLGLGSLDFFISLLKTALLYTYAFPNKLGLETTIKVRKVVCIRTTFVEFGFEECYITVDNWLKNPTLVSALVILSCCISLDVTHIASELVFRFMRICIHVLEDQNQLLAFYPSKLIFAKAAASFMEDQSVLRKLLDFLLNALHTSYIKSGYCGELVAYLLLMFAWDHASRDRDILPHLANLGYLKQFVLCPIRMKKFLISLFRQKNYNEHIQSFFQKLADGLLTQLRTLFIHFTAMICKYNQAGVELIFPVLLDRDESNSILYIFKDETTEENHNFYLSLYLQLSASEPALELFYIENFPAFNTKLQKKAQLEAKKAGKAKTQYCISELGLDKSVYHCLDKLSDDNISILRQLLSAWPDPLNLAKHKNVKSLL
ncbi:hypothetical protein G9A89_012448 [Geosiphon pyriformis]|nr:hypothetical protein G9A89_012448 [Geosiphon pyriformis]